MFLTQTRMLFVEKQTVVQKHCGTCRAPAATMGPCTAMTSLSPASVTSAASMTSTSSPAASRTCMFVRSRSETVQRRPALPPLPSLHSNLPGKASVASVVTALAEDLRARPSRLNAGRSVHYETANTYVFIAPGEEEVFLSRGEVLQCLLNELQSWEKDGKRLSDDLAVFETLEEAAEFLLDSACELELGGGKGALQWFEHQNGSFRTEFAALAADADEHIGFATAALGGNLPEAVNLWIGDERAVTSWHKDHYENFYVVVTGRKTFRLLPPLDVFRMRVREYPAAKYWRAEDEQGPFHILPSDPPCMVPWASVDAALNPLIPCSHTLSAAAAGGGSLGEDPKGPPPLVCTVGPGEMLYLYVMGVRQVC
ncbi:unnamed protein product [Closterium sp. Yama58-4]|nr:unnamed protein product [Closterium sp. Yama58-4]